MHLLLNKSADNVFLLYIHTYIIGNFLCTYIHTYTRACGHPKLTTERQTHRTTLTAGRKTRNMLPQGVYRERRHESDQRLREVLFSTHTRCISCERSTADSWDNPASPLHLPALGFCMPVGFHSRTVFFFFVFFSCPNCTCVAFLPPWLPLIAFFHLAWISVDGNACSFRLIIRKCTEWHGYCHLWLLVILIGIYQQLLRILLQVRADKVWYLHFPLARARVL